MAKNNGTIKITPDEDLSKLPPEEQKWAIKYYLKYLPLMIEALKNSINKFGKALQETRHPLWPKTEKGWQNWRDAYRGICERTQNVERYDMKPTNKDLADYLAFEYESKIFSNKGKPLSERIIREIKKAGRAGLLN